MFVQHFISAYIVALLIVERIANLLSHEIPPRLMQYCQIRQEALCSVQIFQRDHKFVHSSSTTTSSTTATSSSSSSLSTSA